MQHRILYCTAIMDRYLIIAVGTIRTGYRQTRGMRLHGAANLTGRRLSYMDILYTHCSALSIKSSNRIMQLIFDWKLVI